MSELVFVALMLGVTGASWAAFFAVGKVVQR